MRPSPQALLIRRKVTESKVWKGSRNHPSERSWKEPNSDSRSYLDSFRGQRSITPAREREEKLVRFEPAPPIPWIGAVGVPELLLLSSPKSGFALWVAGEFPEVLAPV